MELTFKLRMSNTWSLYWQSWMTPLAMNKVAAVAVQYSMISGNTALLPNQLKTQLVPRVASQLIL